MRKIKEIEKSAIIKNSKIDAQSIKIGKNVELENVEIRAKKIVIGTESGLKGCKIFSDGEISIGEKCAIKEDSIINCFKGIEIGDRCVIDRNVFVGGMQSEHSEIKVGNDCAILYRAYLNSTRKILIGNNVGIGGYTQIFTHSAWQNVLLGHPNKFGDVSIKDNVWIPWNVTVLPGIRIGKNSLVGAGSVVTKNVSSNAFVAGNPAKIKRKKNNSKDLTRNRKEKIVIDIINEFHGYAEGFLKLPNEIMLSKDIKNNTCMIVEFHDSSKIVFMSECREISVKSNRDVIVSFTIPPEIKSKRKSQWIELDSLTGKISSATGRNFVSFIKRFGIRVGI